MMTFDQKSVSAYIDESGNADLETNKKGASVYFIVCAILVDNQDLPQLLSETEIIRKKHFQNGEMKSSGIRDKRQSNRRAKILEEILNLNFHFYAIAVDKSAIDRDGPLSFKKSFLKYINGMLYSRLFSAYADIKIFADEHGSDLFKQSFKKYMEKQHKPDFFWKSEMELVSSNENVLVQLADFIVGTVAKVYEKKATPAVTELFLRLLREKGLGLIEWPTRYQFYGDQDSTSPEYDKFIHTHALAKAETFLEKNSKSREDEIRMQICVLRYIVFQSRLAPDIDYISTKNVLDHLHERGFFKASEHMVRSGVISKLRDKGVIIASSNKGYKIPSSYEDLIDFVETVDGIVVPLLGRLNAARDSYLLASKGEVDLLKGTKYPHLVAFLDDVKKMERI
jgi:hypothetical protein